MGDHVLIAPSILSADFTALGGAIGLVADAGADLIHVDVMDGHFVPNLTIGPPVVKALKRVTDLPLDVHLMIDNADDTVDWYLDAGADMVTVHVEACADVGGVVARIRRAGARPGVSLNPATPVTALSPVLAHVDLVLVMSVNPGFGGQSFIPDALEKIHEVAELAGTTDAQPLIQIDGGIDQETGPRAVAAGARVLVAGSAIFCAEDPAAALAGLRASAEAALP